MKYECNGLLNVKNVGQGLLFYIWELIGLLEVRPLDIQYSPALSDFF